MKKLCKLILLVSLVMVSGTAFSEMQTLRTADNQMFKAYVAGPEDAKKGVLLIHGWLGLNKGVKAWADNMSKLDGHRVMAIDVFNEKLADNPKDAQALVAEVKQDEANAKYRAALQSLEATDRKLAVIGKSYGGAQALYATLSAPQLVSATVSYYPFGKIPSGKETLMQLSGPVLIEAADKDFAFTPDKAEAFKKAMDEADRELILNVYQAGHGFDQAISKNYDEDVKYAADKSTRDFLTNHLK